MNNKQAMDAHHPIDIGETPHQQRARLLNQANEIICEWQESAEEILKKYQESLTKIHTETGSLADDFEFLSYQSIQKKLKLPGEMYIVEDGARVTVAIQFQNKPRNVLRLYLCVIGEVHTPKWLYAELQYQFGRQIAVLQEGLNGNLQEANTQFEAWFSQVMDTMFKDWLDT